MRLHVDVFFAELQIVSVEALEFIVDVVKLLLSHLFISLDIFKHSYFLVYA